MEAIQPAILDEFPRGAHSALAQCRAQLRKQGVTSLPALEGVDYEPLVRWWYRLWMMKWRHRGGEAAPLLFVDPAQMEALHERPWWSIAEGGMVALVGESAPLPPGLREAAQDHQVVVVRPGKEPPLPVNEGFVRALLRFDTCHATAVDPSLIPLRRSLLANCRSGSPVHLKGEGATNKRALAIWAHELLDEAPLVEIRGDQGLPERGRWNFFDGVTALGEQQRRALGQCLDAYQIPRSPAVAGPGGQRPAHAAFRPILGSARALTDVLHTVAGLATSALTILLLGEPGVGKESLARAIHEISGRSGPFVAIDMGAIAENIAESELFGHARGAFTGAGRERAGAFRSAHGGTLFLDEIGNLAPSLQMRLLRVLQERQVLPVGADEPVDVDVRMVAATNADLRLMVMQGRFRQDLLGRLSAATVEVPPLRERIGDLQELGRSFLKDAGVEPGGTALWTEEVDQVFRSYKWPGNVRELANMLGYAAALSQGVLPLQPHHLGPLSPQKMRSTPLITTSSQEGVVQVAGLSTTQSQLMTLATLTVPPVRERSSASRRQMIFDALQGRIISPTALHILENAPWYGNQLELHHRLQPMRSSTANLLDVDELRVCLPDLFAALPLAPIQVLLSPVRQANGAIGGLRFDHHRSAVLVGRVRCLDELRQGDRDGRVGRWLEIIDAVCGGMEPACVDLSLLGRLSRAHLLIHRDADGLAVTLLPGTRLSARGAALTEDVQDLHPGQSMSLGPAGEIELRSSRGNLYLHLFAFSGPVSIEQFGEVALRRAEAARGRVGATLATQAEPGGTSIGASRGLRVWQLNSAEVEALTDIVASFGGGQFNRHILSSLTTLQNRPHCRRLLNYLHDAPRKAQYTVRLFEKDDNQELRRSLQTRLQACPDRKLRVDALPTGLRRILE